MGGASGMNILRILEANATRFANEAMPHARIIDAIAWKTMKQAAMPAVDPDLFITVTVLVFSENQVLPIDTLQRLASGVPPDCPPHPNIKIDQVTRQIR